MKIAHFSSKRLSHEEMETPSDTSVKTKENRPYFTKETISRGNSPYLRHLRKNERKNFRFSLVLPAKMRIFARQTPLRGAWRGKTSYLPRPAIKKGQDQTKINHNCDPKNESKCPKMSLKILLNLKITYVLFLSHFCLLGPKNNVPEHFTKFGQKSEGPQIFDQNAKNDKI